jgi:hypothetical protein
MVGVEACPDPVFIIGSPRSGTSILAWSLAQHSRLWTSAESDFLYHLFGRGEADTAYRKARDRPDGSWLAKQGVSRADFLRHLGLGINALFTSRSRGKRWVDQSPTYTLMAPTLADMFPGASFLHALRDGRRVVHSMTRSGFAAHWAKDFGEACRAWVHFVRLSLDFAQKYPDRCLVVSNEALAARAPEAFAEIFAFLQVPYEDGPAHFLRTNRINSSFEPAAPAAAGAPPAPGQDPWAGWTPDQKAIFRDLAGPTLVRLGMAAEGDLGPDRGPVAPDSYGRREAP